MVYYVYFKLIHLVAVVIFLGNIITGFYWMRAAVKTKDLKIIAHTVKYLIRADKYFTTPGVIILTAGGLLAAIYGQIPILKTGWIFLPIVLFSISGIAFAYKVAPLQKKILVLTSSENLTSDFDWKNLMKIYREWDIWGLFALITPLAAFVMMILKVPH